jgi:hypothetical protein
MDELKLIHDTLLENIGEMCDIHTYTTVYEDCYILEVTDDTVLIEAYSEVKSGMREFLLPIDTIQSVGKCVKKS